jgi:hypothetical protein
MVLFAWEMLPSGYSWMSSVVYQKNISLAGNWQGVPRKYQDNSILDQMPPKRLVFPVLAGSKIPRLLRTILRISRCAEHDTCTGTNARDRRGMNGSWLSQTNETATSRPAGPVPVFHQNLLNSYTLSRCCNRPSFIACKSGCSRSSSRCTDVGWTPCRPQGVIRSKRLVSRPTFRASP